MQHSALSYVCDQGVRILNHQYEQIPWVHVYRVKNGQTNVKKGQEYSIRSKMVNMVKTGRRKKRSKKVKKWSKTVTKRSKRSWC